MKKPERFPTPTELQNASTEHHQAYSKIKREKGLTSTSRMLLFYAVECRLKAILYKDFRKPITKNPKRSNKYYDWVMSHKLDMLINELKIPKIGTCPNVKLKNGSESYRVELAHSLWRYGFDMEEDSESALVRWLETVYKNLKRIR
jgi:hypothetical protein